MSSISNVCFKLFNLVLRLNVYKGCDCVQNCSASPVSVGGVIILQLIHKEIGLECVNCIHLLDSELL
jgi:hypothetical protein